MRFARAPTLPGKTKAGAIILIARPFTDHPLEKTRLRGRLRRASS
jgi:hypothetical protein